jgi:uncharacterized protein YggE
MRKSMVVLAFAALPMFAQQPPCDVHSITVTGMGTAKIVPDRVSFTVGVFTNAPTVSEAFKTNNEKTQRVVAALKQRGVKDTEIQTSNFSIQTAYDNYPQRKQHGFNVTNSVTVTREDPKAVSELIQAAVDAGANEADGVRFFNSDPAATRDRAIERAVKDARMQAEKLAVSTGGTLGRATAISSAQVPSYGYMQNNNVMAESITVSAGAPAIEAGTNTLSYSVTITYEIK